MSENEFSPNSKVARIVVVGGCGHVGLPLALAFAREGQATASFDIDRESVDAVNDGRMPFNEPEAPQILKEVLRKGTFSATTNPAVLTTAEIVIIVIGTPVDGHLNPDAHAVPDAVSELSPHLRNGQLLILRSTVYPGVTKLVEERIGTLGIEIDVAFCPERIAEGKAFTELYSLPQIVSGRKEGAIARASELFYLLTDSVVVASPEEAELAKLFTNTWRYIKFAAANQFFMIANSHGIDFERVRRTITTNYPRAEDLPGAGFAAGPCLFKDTMQLAAFNNNTFFLGHASMMVNEGLPMYVVERMEKRFELKSKTIGILGMAFKGESDDTRSSLSYKLKRILRFRAGSVLCTDPYVTTDASLLPLDEVVARSDILVIGAPHKIYGDLDIRVDLVDIWNLRGQGTLL